MRMVLCDDDSIFLEQLTAYIRKFFEKISVKCPELVCYPDGNRLLADDAQTDILFLDIEMPGPDGIFVGNELKKRNKDMIIFIVTSYSEYLDDAMRFQVFRYLTKPLDKQRFFRNMQDAIDFYHSLTRNVAVETRDGVHTVPVASIIAVEAQGRKVVIHTDAGDFLSTHNMQYWLDVLPENCFFRTHRSFIVNFKHVTEFDHSIVRMADNQLRAYLTKRNYSAFKNAYLFYLESTR